ncbi:MAG: CopG family transcriptional regulator [Actinomycetota bacterium]
MPATRTQIYLTAEQRRRLDQLARGRDASLAEVIRDAVDAYLERVAPDPSEALEATFGALPRLKVPPRDEWDRG